jgi:hypothetical protein
MKHKKDRTKLTMLTQTLKAAIDQQPVRRLLTFTLYCHDGRQMIRVRRWMAREAYSFDEKDSIITILTSAQTALVSEPICHIAS